MALGYGRWLAWLTAGSARPLGPTGGAGDQRMGQRLLQELKETRPVQRSGSDQELGDVLRVMTQA
ncbi:MAG: hypothetical protein Udaeo2_12670 [Candidatus Udaeobacter sp.]|nr:MAG: hypothetical protein Udaeo2_12670 [Candidatus Udaeobacter sp.]